MSIGKFQIAEIVNYFVFLKATTGWCHSMFQHNKSIAMMWESNALSKSPSMKFARC